jgi:AcrR family transcriptional regulator
VCGAERAKTFTAAGLRAGPAGLTTRAITAEAGVANGVMHRHFRDLDVFLAEFASSRFAALAGTAASLPSGAGQGSVAANLTDASWRCSARTRLR